MRKAAMLVTAVALCLALSGLAVASSSNNTGAGAGAGVKSAASFGLHGVGTGNPSTPPADSYYYLDFPGTGDAFCGTNTCGTLGVTPGYYTQTDYSWTTGNYVQSTFFGLPSGGQAINDLTAGWVFQDYLATGSYEQWNVYVNDTWVAYADIYGSSSCYECGGYYSVGGTVTFGNVAPMGGGFLVTLLNVSPNIGAGLGSIAWGNADYFGGGTIISATPEPGSLMLLGSGLLGLGAVVRRRLGR